MTLKFDNQLTRALEADNAEALRGIIQQMADLGIDLNQPVNRHGETLAHILIRRGRLPAESDLISHIDPRATDKDGRSVMQAAEIAAWNTSPAVVAARRRDGSGLIQRLKQRERELTAKRADATVHNRPRAKRSLL